MADSYTYNFVHVIARGSDETESATYHFTESLEHTAIQSYTVDLFVYALRSVNFRWCSNVKLIRILTISIGDKPIVYAFTGREIGAKIEYFEIGKYDTIHEDENFLNTGNKVIVYSNQDNSLAVLINVDVTDSSVTDAMFKHEVPLTSIPGWENVTAQDLINSAGIFDERMETKFIDAARDGNLSLVKQCLIAGVNVHAKDDEALRLAAKKGNTEILKVLLANDANIHAMDDYALRWAVWNGHVEVVLILLANGANIHARSDLALRWAVQKANVEIVKLLLIYSLTHTRYMSHIIYAALSKTRNAEIKQLLNNYNIAL
jgi:hypothetical protein